MHKSKVAVGIGIIVIGGILLLIEIMHGVRDELTYQQCLHPPAPHFPDEKPFLNSCQHFLDHIKPILIYIGVLGIGVWVFVFGLKSISLKSFSRE